MNNGYTLTAKDPLLRPGLTIRTTCSEKYVVDVAQALINMVRDINHLTPPAIHVKKSGLFTLSVSQIEARRKGNEARVRDALMASKRHST